jgi:hypothetical protein
VELQLDAVGSDFQKSALLRMSALRVHTASADVVLMRRLSLLAVHSKHQRKPQAHPRARSHSADQFNFTRAQV